MQKILLIEDDPDLNRNVCEALRAENFHVESSFDGQLAAKMLRRNPYDCVVLDVNLPGKTGFEVCKEFREYNKHTPVLMLTAFDQLEDKEEGFQAGADDYLTKPFFMKELQLRIDALIKRSKNVKSPDFDNIIKKNTIIIDDANKKVTRKGVEIELTPREYEILLMLVRADGQLVTKRELMEKVWGVNFDTQTNSLEVYMNFLRKKIDKRFGYNTLKTKVGFGYYFDDRNT